MSIVYVEGTLSPGALVCVLPINDKLPDFASMKLVTIHRSINSNCTLPDLSGGEYRVVAFDLETNTLPREPVSMAADSETINITSDNVGRLRGQL